MYYGFGEYVSVAQKQAKAEKLIAKLRKQGRQLKPVAAFKGKMAATFWGKSWCRNLESYADYENRLGRGRSYVRSGCVCHLEIEDGMVKALISGSDLYTVTVRIQAPAPERWRAVCARCAGQVGSLFELLQGKLSEQVMKVMCDQATGIFPSPAEMRFACSCPDWASMCKHVAVALYGIGRRLDTEPELLFVLRGVNAADLIPASLDFTQNTQIDALRDDDLGALFGIDLDMDTNSSPPPVVASPKNPEPIGQKPRRKISAKDVPATTAKPPFKPERPTGYAIRRLRHLANLTPSAFAHALGISPATLYRWEESKGVLSLRPASVESLVTFQRKLVSGR